MGNRPLAAADAPNLPRSDDTTLRLLTYNVHSCVGTDGAYNFKRVGRVAASVNPDVVALQEVECNSQPRKCRYWSTVHSDDQVSQIAAECGLEHVCFKSTLSITVPERRWQYSSSCTRPPIPQHEPRPTSKEVLEPSTGAGYGNALISRWPILETRVLAYSKPVPADTTIDMQREEQPRLAMACLIQLPHGQPALWVVNTHLSHRFWNAEQRRQAGQLATWIREELLVRSPGGQPVILCGDMNALPSCTAHAELTARGGQDLWGRRMRVPTMPSFRYTRWWPNKGWIVAGHIDNIFAFSTAANAHTPSASTAPSESAAAAYSTERVHPDSAVDAEDAVETTVLAHPEGETSDSGIGVRARLTVLKSSTEALVASDHCSVMADILLTRLT